VWNGYICGMFLCHLVNCSMFLDLGGVIISKIESQPIIQCVLEILINLFKLSLAGIELGRSANWTIHCFPPTGSPQASSVLQSN